MNILRRTMSALLALVMVLTMLPVSVLATETKSVTVPEETAPAGEVALDVPKTIETEPAETVPETAPATEPADPTPEAAVPEETWEIGDIKVEETAETVAAAEVLASGDCGENATWSLDGEGLLTISGSGEISGKWSNVKEQIKRVIIEDGITAIGGSAFSKCTSLSEISLPASVASIGSEAFSGCTQLAEIKIPEGVTTIGEGVFSQCDTLTEITIPASVTSLGKKAFYQCDNLTSVILGDNVTSIPESAFYRCEKLTSVNMPKSITSIGKDAFSQCTSLSDISIGEGVTTIGKEAFYRCSSLREVVIPDSVTSIAQRAFYICEGITSITIGNGLTSIEKQTFSDNTNLKEVTFGNSISKIGESAFSDCKSLIEITLPNTVESIGKSAFLGCKALTAVDIGGEKTAIMESAFSGCSSLTSVTIQDSVTFIGEAAFSRCTSLGSFTIPNSMTSIGERVFSECTSLNSIIIPDSVISIGKSAFENCTGLTNVSLGKGLGSIGAGAFSGCTSLNSIEIPDSVTSIAGVAFEKCTGMVSVTIGAGLSSFNTRTFENCNNLANFIVDENNSNYASENGMLCSKDMTTLILCPAANAYSYTIPEGVITIDKYAFQDCAGMTAVFIPASVTTINNYAFSDSLGIDSTNLENVYFGGSPEQWEQITIGKYGNEGLISADVIPNADGIPDKPTDPGEEPEWSVVHESFLKPIKQITDPEDIPYGYTGIYSQEDLMAINQNRSGKYVLMADIELENWYSLCSYSSPFTGVLNGNGHTISGLDESEYSTPSTHWGLFAAIDGAKIYNLRLSGSFDVKVGSNHYIGSLAGDAKGDIKITNCVNDVAFNCTAEYSDYIRIYLGGLIGRYTGTGATITDCRNTADISSLGNTGGLVGYMELSSGTLTISNCHNEGNLLCTKKVSPDDISGLGGPFGGIAGEVYGKNAKVIISGCINRGDIIAGKKSSGGLASGNNAGGIVGSTYSQTTIASCANTGDVSAILSAGGIAAYLSEQSVVQDCLNTGTIDSNNALYNAGGIAAGGGTFLRCLNTGLVKTPPVQGKSYNSGIVGNPSGNTEAEAEAAIVDCYWLDDGQTNTLYSLYSNDFSESKAIRTRGMLSLEELTVEENFQNFSFPDIWVMDHKLKHPFPAAVHVISIEEYIDNSTIRINGSGSAYAYYQSDPNTTFQYTVNGNTDSATSDDKGIIRIMLGTWSSSGTYENTIWFTKAGNKILSPAVGFKATVVSTKLEYTQQWQVSLDAGIGANLNAGVEVDAGAFHYQATLGKLGAKANISRALSISHACAAGNSTLELTSDTALGPEFTFESGVSADIIVADLDIAQVSASAEAIGTGTTGLKIENYSFDNPSHQKAVATFLLGEMLQMYPNCIILKQLHKELKDTVYQESGAILIEGYAAAAGGSFGGALGGFSVNGNEIFTMIDGTTEGTVAAACRSYSDGEKEYETSYNMKDNLKAVSIPVLNGALGGVLGLEYLGRDITVKAQIQDTKKALETTTLRAGAVNSSTISLGKKRLADYDRYTFEADSLKELTNHYGNYSAYVNGKRLGVSNGDLNDMAEHLTHNETPVAYANLEKVQQLYTLPVEFGVSMGIGFDMDVEMSYLQSIEHEKNRGYAVADEILINSEPEDYSSEISSKVFSLEEMVSGALTSLKEKTAEFFKTVTDGIKNGAKTVWGWIDEKNDSIHDWLVSITTPDGEQSWNSSEKIDVSIGGRSITYRFAVTVGRPFIVSVMDNATGEEIMNFEEEPLEFTIRYAGEDLMAAGYDVETQVISMYRYSDEGDYFEYIGGIHNAEEKTVTATITKPGQYILAAEAIEEEGCGFELGDVNHDGKINAKDATLILQKSVGVLKETAKFCEDCAEVSGDGKLNAKDSTLILQFSVGLRTEFPASSK